MEYPNDSSHEHMTDYFSKDHCFFCSIEEKVVEDLLDTTLEVLMTFHSNADPMFMGETPLPVIDGAAALLDLLSIEHHEDGTKELSWGHGWLELATIFIRGVFEAREEVELFMMSMYQGPMPEA